MKHLTLVEGERREYHDTDYWRHPVHGGRALQTKAVETVAQAFGDDPYSPQWALTVLTLAVGGNSRAIGRASEALEWLGAHFSKPANRDDCSPVGLPRPFPVDIA